MVSDRGNRCLFNFLCGRRLFFEVFPFPICKAQFIGDWLENRRGAPNLLADGAPVSPSANRQCWPDNSTPIIFKLCFVDFFFNGAPLSHSANRQCWPCNSGPIIFIKGCSVAQWLSARHPMEVPPTEPTAMKIWRWASANVYECMMYVYLNVSIV